MSSSDYLSSLTLQNVGDDLKYASPLKKFSSRRLSDGSSSSAMVLGGVTPISTNVTLYHAPLSYFDIDQLTPKGPRQGADVGTPYHSSRPLVRGISTSSNPTSTLSAGSWWCTQGGWPSKKQRATTEIFFVLQGFGCLTDIDGNRNFFGPGDTVILPKGWSGRWDVAEAIHKVWFVHQHDKIEEDLSSTIRARIFHYHDMVAPPSMPPLQIRQDATHNTTPQSTSKVVYEVGSTNVGYWISTPGSFSVSTPKASTEGFHLLEGMCFLTNAVDGTTQRCVAGDTVVLPAGWSGDWDVVETVKKLWVEI